MAHTGELVASPVVMDSCHVVYVCATHRGPCGEEICQAVDAIPEAVAGAPTATTTLSPTSRSLFYAHSNQGSRVIRHSGAVAKDAFLPYLPCYYITWRCLLPPYPEVPRVTVQARLPQYKPREKWVVVNKGPPTAPEDQAHWSTWNTRTPFHPPTAPQHHVNSVPSRPKTAPPGEFREEEQEWTTYRTVKTPPHAMTGYTAYPQSHQPIPPPQHRPVSAMTTDGQVGKFKTWAQNADDYEKQIVYDMLKSLNGGKSAGPERSQPSSMRVHVATRGSSPVRLEKSASQNRATRSAPARQRRKLAPTGANNGPPPAYRLNGVDGRVDGNPREEKILKDYMEDLEEKAYLSQIFKSSGGKKERQVESGKTKVTIARLPPNPPRWYRNQPKKSLDYTCNVSFFQHVRPPHRSHFIIAPDWTSERLTVKKRIDHMVASSV
ncbi:hypothetical protein Bbelb_205900 [Branchiostoma belcheri]|nr:hypothetical protein Bbelb_205900 [Branchiostoma belcheri]